MYSYI